MLCSSASNAQYKCTFSDCLLSNVILKQAIYIAKTGSSVFVSSNYQQALQSGLTEANSSGWRLDDLWSVLCAVLPDHGQSTTGGHWQLVLLVQ